LVRISAASPIQSLELQNEQPALEPACVAAGFHPHSYPQAALPEFAVELLGLFPVRQPSFA
jgi:hypothetical protein